MLGANDIRPAESARARRRIAIVAFHGANPLDVAGPSTVFATAEGLRPGAYDLVHASPGEGRVVSESGLSFAGLVPLAAVPDPIDTLLVVGGGEAALTALGRDAGFLAMLRDRSRRARRVGAVCTGAFVLAAAGLLDGRRAVTHWAACDRLQAMFPSVRVTPDPIFVSDGGVFTSAGVSAGIDLALALVEEDLGRETAAAVARSMVVFLRRPGGQSQFSEALSAQAKAGGAFGGLVAWIADNLPGDLSIAALADRAGMSERTFQRRFRAETGRSPSDFVRAMRVEAARRWLETTDWPLERVARQAGFGSVDSLERAFLRTWGRPPGALRAGFGLRQDRPARAETRG
jgi:transcriptional regulator GlxA family with amidase domain